MKKTFLVLAIAAAIVSCNSNNSTDSGDTGGTGPRATDEDTTATNVQHVENANGNMPDTTNSINIGTEKTGTADTTKH